MTTTLYLPRKEIRKKRDARNHAQITDDVMRIPRNRGVIASVPADTTAPIKTEPPAIIAERKSTRAALTAIMRQRGRGKPSRNNRVCRRNSIATRRWQTI